MRAPRLQFGLKTIPVVGYTERTMFRFSVVCWHVVGELLDCIESGENDARCGLNSEAAREYWREVNAEEASAPDYVERGDFSVGGGD